MTITITAISNSARADEPVKPADTNPPTKDQSLDELLNIKKKPAEPRKDEAKPAPKTPRQALPDDAPGEPFRLAVEGMEDAAERLGDQKDAGIDTQRVQEKVVSRLDNLISQFKRNKSSKSQQQTRQQDSGSQEKDAQVQQADQTSTNPAQNSGKRGQARTGQPGDQPLKEGFNEWGNLPPRLRDQLRNGLKDNYSSLYKDLTEKYYRRLAEEAPQ